MIAPEIFPAARTSLDKYGSKANVWSAGVIAAQLYLIRVPSLPNTRAYDKGGEREGRWHEWHEEWAAVLLQKIRDEPEDDDQVIDLILRMLEPDPEKRLSAEDCLESGCQNGLFRKTDDGDYAVAKAGDDGGVRTPMPLQRVRETGAPSPSSHQPTPISAKPKSKEPASYSLPPAAQAAFLFGMEGSQGFKTPSHYKSPSPSFSDSVTDGQGVEMKTP